MGSKNGNDCCCTKISLCNLGLAIGVVWGLGILLTALLSIWVGMGTPIVELFSSIYLGYEATYTGALVGLFWGFIDGFVGGVLIAFFYNLFSRICASTCCR